MTKELFLAGTKFNFAGSSEALYNDPTTDVIMRDYYGTEIVHACYLPHRCTDEGIKVFTNVMGRSIEVYRSWEEFRILEEKP